MNLEIERKFLFKPDFRLPDVSFDEIKQAYISRNPENSVRVRLKGDTAFLTIKGKSNKKGTTRFEFEKEISMKDAKELFEICKIGIIEKTRYYYPSGKHIFEIDVFKGENKGLILAEVELQNENETFSKPNWLGKEVTGDIRFYNSYLSKHPYNRWSISNCISDNITCITEKMIEYFEKDVRRINHALKVNAYARIIAKLEKISSQKKEILEIASILHDIGIKVCEEKYNSVSGNFQEIEGPPIAKEIMESVKISKKTIERVLFLIANHHTYNNIDNIDFQILVEADFLVNFEEGNISMEVLPNTKKNIFKTKTGLHFLNTIFLTK